jgi:hypothetical protein
VFLRYNINIETVKLDKKKVIWKIVDIHNAMLGSVVFVCVLSKINCDYN